jgi:hypothetical protein
MAFDTDPYRALGLARNASLDEVKRAYRRLAKANHPDAAGAGALSRFLAIQAAYEQLAGGSTGPVAKARQPAASTPRPSEADPERADATRRAYGGRPRGRRRPTNEEAGPPRTPGGPGGSETSGPRGKATLGSTSYDGADAGPFEPDWGGASWYGTTSGTYWTINPKEYADPRKHGPEYQARARRSSTARPRTGPKTQDAPYATEPDAETGGATGPTHTTSSWWDSTPGPAESSADRAGRTTTERPFGPPAPIPEEPAPDPARAAADLARALMDPRSGGLPGRIMRAFVGWLPIALGLGWLFGELTGCGRFAATCETSADPLILVVQGAALVALVLLPAAASLAASAALGLLVGGVAATLILSATGTAADEGSRRATLGGLLLVAWIAGLVIAIARRVRSAPSPTSPVS